MYPYHNRNIQRIRNGELIDHYFVDNYPKIGEAMVLLFNSEPHRVPVRPHAYHKYVNVLAEWKRGES